MPVKPTEDNPHGWGFIENRTIVEEYQLSPRIKIVVGDEIKVSKGPYWVNKDGVKVSLDKMKGKWKVNGIFKTEGEFELDLVHIWPGGLFGSMTTIRITGDEYPSPVVPSVIRRPYKVRLATPKYKRRKKTYTERKEAVKSVEKPSLDSLKNLTSIIKESKNAKNCS